MHATGIKLSPAVSEQDLILRNAKLYEGVPSGQGALVGEIEVVSNPAALIGIAFDGELHVGVSFQPLGILLQGGLVIGGQIVVIPLEVDVLDVATKRLPFVLGSWRGEICRSGVPHWLNGAIGIVLP